MGDAVRIYILDVGKTCTIVVVKQMNKGNCVDTVASVFFISQSDSLINREKCTYIQW